MLNIFSNFRFISIVTGILLTGFLPGHSASPKPQYPLRLPSSEVIIERIPYVMAYDGRNKQARWVYEVLTAESVQGNADRHKFIFEEDPLIPSLIRSTKEDYTGSGFDRGHLCPAADARLNDAQMKETFYFSNVSPQCPQFNRGYWLKLERHVRDLAKRHGVIHVFTGGLYLPYQDSDGKRYVKYQVIGQNDVAVPTHYFKVILGKDRSSLESFILPNESIPGTTPLNEFLTTIEKIEKVSGIIFSKK